MRLLKRYQQLGETFKPQEILIKPSLRVNTLKISEEKLIIRLKEKKIKLTKIPYLENGYYYESNFSLGATPEYLLGYYYLQEAASQLPVQVLCPAPSDQVLDMAASPGSKTTQIAQKMQNKGEIIALDTDSRRLKSLVNNLERLSITNTLVFKKDARFCEDLNMKFDKILLDAPCSGNFCVEKNFFQKRTEQDFKDRSKLQKELIKAAIKCLKKEGTLVYSTCSLEPEENELVIDWALKEFPEIKLENTNLKIGQEGYTTVFGEELNPALKLTRRFWPHKTQTEGFFIAKLVKK